jgi:hypothetical protein
MLSSSPTVAKWHRRWSASLASPTSLVEPGVPARLTAAFGRDGVCVAFPFPDRVTLHLGSVLCSLIRRGVTLRDMNTANQPNVKFVQTPDYREAYSNSVQIRVNVWDFFLVFGTMQQNSETQVELRNFQGIYLSPQQAKALMALLQQNVSNYEAAFGEIKLDPRAPGGQIH